MRTFTLGDSARPGIRRRKEQQRKRFLMVLWAVREAVWTVALTPDAGTPPGGAVLQHLTDGLGGWALIMALVGLVIGAAAWALGAHSQNSHRSFNGRPAGLAAGVA